MLSPMRRARIKNAPGEAACFHIVCRTYERQFLFESAEEKRRLLLWLEKAADFCGVRLHAWCLMSNHVHLLVHVPAARPIDDAELLRRMRRLYLPRRFEAILRQWSMWERIDGNSGRVDAAKARLKARMHDISSFAKTFKQAVAEDYNDRHNHSGSIWGGTRFKSVYLQDALAVRLSVATYIHLNPCRAGMVPTPSQYAWSSWGAACAAPGRARDGLIALFGSDSGWAAVHEQLKALHKHATDRRERKEPVTDNKGKRMELPLLSDIVAVKSPLFTASPVLGSEAFIQRVFGESQGARPHARVHRKTVPLAAWNGQTLCTLSDRRFGRSPFAPSPPASAQSA